MALARRLIVLMAVAALVALVADSAMAQPGGRGRGGPGGGGGFGGGFGGGGAMDLLQNQSVQKELELLDDQVAQIRELSQDNSARDRMRELFGGLRDLPEEERRAKITEAFATMRQEQQKEIDKILLPHQSERLGQIENQMAARRGGGVIGGQLAEDLGITEQQREEMREAAEKAFAEMREQQQKLQAEAQEKILAVLTPAQRQKYKQMMGEPFDYQADQGGRGGFQRGGGGGGFQRGGNAGGADGGRRGARPAN
ncbi:MAG: hypothetical protein RIC55_04710 [Pirellulaceae bacterium]